MARSFWAVLFLAVVTGSLLFTFISKGRDHQGDSLLVYTSRQDHLVKPLFELYEQQTGVKVRWVSGDAPVLIERLKQEGERSAVDLLLTVDAGNLWQAAQLGLLEPLSSELLQELIPAHLRDPQGQWYGVSVRARTVVYNSEAIDPASLSTYEDLADPKWQGQLCLRTSKKVYNQSLVAMLIERLGPVAAEEVVRGWVNNLAAPVFSNDTHLIEALDAGTCQVGIVNTYYLGRYQINNPDTRVKIFWPNQETSGVHVNITGAGVLSSSRQKDKAQQLLEWMAGREAQEILAHSNMEYPAVPSVEADLLVQSWGPFVQDDLTLEAAGRQQVEAIKLMDRVGYH